MVSIGAFVLSQSLASMALASGFETACYSTGPLENEVTTPSATFTTTVLNNDHDDAIVATIVTYDLNGMLLSGPKLLNDVTLPSLFVAPLSSTSYSVDTTVKNRYEVQVKVIGKDVGSTLLGGFGTDAADELVSSHRLVHSEWTKIECLDFERGLELSPPAPPPPPPPAP
jgi:hypothetical protein